MDFVLFRKHAYIDLASEMDVTKALTLDGEMVLDKPIKVEKAKIKSAKKVKLSAEEKKGNTHNCQMGYIHKEFLVTSNWQLLCFTAIKNRKCLRLKNVPYDTTRERLLKIFDAVDVRFPGGTESPKKGYVFRLSLRI